MKQQEKMQAQSFLIGGNNDATKKESKNVNLGNQWNTLNNILPTYLGQKGNFYFEKPLSLN